MDPRIGMLMRAGTTVHYAFVNGYDQPAFEGPLEAVEAALGLRAPGTVQHPTAEPPVDACARPAKRSPASRLHDYIVTVTPKYVVYCGSFTEQEHEVEVTAATARDAIRLVRKRRREEDGSLVTPATFRARRSESSESR